MHESAEISSGADSVALVAPLACLLFQPAQQSPIPFREPASTQVSAEKTHAILQRNTSQRHAIELHQIAFPATCKPPTGKTARAVIVHKIKLRLCLNYRDQQLVGDQVTMNEAEPMKLPHQLR